MVRLLEQLSERIEEATGLAPLNHPSRSLRRFELIHALHAEGMIPYSAYGAWEDYSEVRLPAFVRLKEADGGVPELRHSLRDLEKDIATHLVRGWTLDDLIVCEFTDTAVDDVYTKYSVYRIGESYIPVTMDRGTDWVLRRPSSDVTMELIKAAKIYQSTNPHDAQVRRIFEISNIEFGRVDYSMLDGNVICWEINTLPTLRRPPGVSALPAELQEARKPARELSRARFREAFKLVLEGAEAALATSEAPHEQAPKDVLTQHDPELLAAARAEIEAAGGIHSEAGKQRWSMLRALLRPFKPIVKPVVEATVYPILARRARRASK